MERAVFVVCALAGMPALAERAVPIDYDARQPWARPTVEGKGFARRPRLLLDTGSGDHFVAARMAPGAGAGDLVGRDFLGRPIRGAPLDEGALALPGWGAVSGPLYASTFTDDLQRAERPRPGQEFLDGLLTPQLLASPGHAVVLDFQRGVLVEETWQEARARVGAAGVPLGEGEVRASGPDKKFIVRAEACGSPALLAVDTGAPRSSLYRARDPDVPDGAARFAGCRTRMRIGDIQAEVDLQLIEPIGSSAARDQRFDGLLGMDVLRDCVLAVDGERMVAACRAEPSPAHEETVMPHRAACVPNPGRAVTVQMNGRGPQMRQHADGSYTWAGYFVAARIARDGSIQTWDLADAPGDPMPMRDDDRSEKRWLLDETSAFRAALYQDDARRLADQSIDGLPSLLGEVWGGSSPSPARHATLLALWDDAVEPDDPTLGVAGARARAAIDRFIRARLPAGSSDGFTAPEIAGYNARRPRGLPRFNPYAPPPPRDATDASDD